MVSCSLMDQTKDAEVLPSYEDEHGGIIVEMKEPMDPNDFALMLRYSLSQWKLQGKKGVWIKLPIKLVNLAEAAIKEGFLYHHAEPYYLMLVKWIPETPSTIPANATHRLRIGAIILNDKRELLVVLEKHGRFKGTGIWKIPTGMVEEGEDIFLGATREVKEETGVDTEFIDVLAFRQMHKTFFQKSDLFFLCMMRPLSFGIQIQESEIDGAQWMPIDEYAAQPFAEQHSVFKYAADICLAKVEKGYTGLTHRVLSIGSGRASPARAHQANAKVGPCWAWPTFCGLSKIRPSPAHVRATGPPGQFRPNFTKFLKLFKN